MKPPMDTLMENTVVLKYRDSIVLYLASNTHTRSGARVNALRASFFFFRVQSQIAVWPLERMRHLCSVRHGSFTEVVVA